MPTPSVASVVSERDDLGRVLLGLREQEDDSASPTAGTKIASVSAHSWNQFICPSS